MSTETLNPALAALFPDKSDPVLRCGMGCGALGGSLSASRSLHVLDAAFDTGICYFDVARSYGFGEAEKLVGQFARERRDQVVIATKLGAIHHPVGPLKRWSRQRFARPVRKMRARLSREVPKRRSVAGASSLAGRRFTREEIQVSFEQSLAALKTDYVDVLHLHSIAADGLTDEMVSFLERLLSSGKVRALGTASPAPVCRELLAAHSVLSIAQFRDNLLESQMDVGRSLPAGLITHSVLGRDGHLRAYLLRRLREPSSAASSLSALAGADVRTAAGLVRLLLGLGLHRNPAGLTLCGLTDPQYAGPLAELARNPFEPAAADEAWTQLQNLLS